MLDIRDHGGLFGGVNRNKYKRWASGTGVTGADYKLTVTGLGFKPSTVIVNDGTKKSNYQDLTTIVSDNPFIIHDNGTPIDIESLTVSTLRTSSPSNFILTNGGFTVAFGYGTGIIGTTVKWLAFE